MTPGSRTAIAHPNIALAKYWGKISGGQNLPAVPSLSITLAGMATTTTVTFDPKHARDELFLNGAPADAQATSRVAMMLDRVRSRSGLAQRARVVSANDFPTASGLASSASAFAALALAASAAAGLELDAGQLSDLARRSSVSAARSIFGGFAELSAGTADAMSHAAEAVVGRDHWALRVVVAVTRDEPKSIGSTQAMKHTAETSPYYSSWLAAAPELFRIIRAAVVARDLEALGAASERSALLMHAVTMAASPPILYWTGATVDVLEEVRRLRARGIAAYATMDAGPHVKVITAPPDAARVADALRAIQGVTRVITAEPGAGAQLISTDVEASP